MTQSELIAEITAAFKDEPYPGDANIVYDNSGFHLECLEVRDAFMGNLWQGITDAILSAERTGLAFMSKQGFKYYLPAFMCFALRDVEALDEGLGMMLLLLKLPTEIDIAVVADAIHRHEVASKLPDVDLNEVLQNQLAHTNAEINSFIARATQFTRAQGRAIYHFLVYMRDEHSELFLNNEPDLAVQRYWFQFA